MTTLTDDDAAAIATDVAGVSAVSPGLGTRTQVVSAGGNWQAQVQGVGADLAALRTWPVQSGTFIDGEQVARAMKVAVLGAVVRDQLFGPGTDAVGQTIRINNQPFTVIGVLSRKGQTPMGQDQDDTVMVPYTTAQKRLLGVTHLSNLTVGLDGTRSASAVSNDMAALLRQRHRLQAHDADDFTIRSPEEMAAVLTSTTDHDVVAALRRRRDLAGRRRDRDHEHHAGVGDRADPRRSACAAPSARAGPTSWRSSSSRRWRSACSAGPRAWWWASGSRMR